jgi:hypothetical protein
MGFLPLFQNALGRVFRKLQNRDIPPQHLDIVRIFDRRVIFSDRWGWGPKSPLSPGRRGLSTKKIGKITMGPKAKMGPEITEMEIWDPEDII